MRFKVDGMTCAHCVRAVETAVQEAAPGASASVDLAGGTLVVSGPADADRIVRAIAEEGYDATVLPD